MFPGKQSSFGWNVPGICFETFSAGEMLSSADSLAESDAGASVLGESVRLAVTPEKHFKSQMQQEELSQDLVLALGPKVHRCCLSSVVLKV